MSVLRHLRLTVAFTLFAATAFAAESEVGRIGNAQDLLAARHSPFQIEAAAGSRARAPARRSIGVQIERNETGLRLGKLSFPYLFEALYKHHAAAAAHILDRSADERSGRDIPVYNIDDGFFDYPTGDFRGIVRAADVISLSQRSTIVRTADTAFSGASSSYASSDGLEVLRDLWRESDTVVFHAIGNDAANVEQAYPETNLNWIFNDLYVRVGTGRALADGRIAVDAHSPPHAVTLLTEIPDYRYQLFSDPQKAEERTFAYLQDNRAFYQADLIRAVATGANSPFNLGYCRGKSGYEKPFDGRALLDRPPYAQLSAPLSDLFRAYSTCAAETLRDWYVSNGRDPAQSHSLRQITGTSFSAPEAAGSFLAMHESFPTLSKHDILAAMIVAAEPAQVVLDETAPPHNLANRPNGRGLLRSEAAGFGLVTWTGFKARTDALLALQASAPALETVEADFTSDIVVFDPDKPAVRHGVRDYVLPISQDSLFFRGVLVMSFGDGNRDVPQRIELIDPHGAAISLTPGRYVNGSRLVLAGTDAFFGIHTAGTWRIRVPENHRLHAAGLAVEGVAAGPRSLIDVFLTESGFPDTPEIEMASPGSGTPKL